MESNTVHPTDSQQPIPLIVPSYDPRTWASRAQWHVLDQEIPKYRQYRAKRMSSKFWHIASKKAEEASQDLRYTLEDRLAHGRPPIVPTHTVRMGRCLFAAAN